MLKIWPNFTMQEKLTCFYCGLNPEKDKEAKLCEVHQKNSSYQVLSLEREYAQCNPNLLPIKEDNELAWIPFGSSSKYWSE